MGYKTTVDNSSGPRGAGAPKGSPSRPSRRNDPEVPEHLLCPISYELFRDPVILGSGRTYERKCILAEFARSEQQNLRRFLN